jgi:hypothetical protein
MAAQPKYRTYQPAPTAQFADGKSARPIPTGTVPRGTSPLDDVISLSTSNPLAINRPTLEAGQQQFEIFCAPCHGRLGNGDGMIVQRGFKVPPSFHSDRLRQAPAGHFFEVMTRGFGVMYDYRGRITPEDRWAIAAYIRALQLSQHAGSDDLDAAKAEASREAAAAKASKNAAASAGTEAEKDKTAGAHPGKDAPQ